MCLYGNSQLGALAKLIKKIPIKDYTTCFVIISLPVYILPPLALLVKLSALRLITSIFAALISRERINFNLKSTLCFSFLIVLFFYYENNESLHYRGFDRESEIINLCAVLYVLFTLSV